MLLIYAPEDGSTVSGSSVVVYGQTVPGARVFVSGNETGVDAEGGFRVSVPLDPAENEVLIMARNDAGDQRRVTRRVTSLALPFLLLVTEPANESVVSTPSLPLSGRTGPSAIVSINGRSVPVDRFGYFSGSVRAGRGPQRHRRGRYQRRRPDSQHGAGRDISITELMAQVEQNVV